MTKALWMIIKKDKLLNVSITNLLQFTINVRNSHRRPQYTFKLVYEDRVFFVWIDLHLSLRWQQHPKCERAIRHRVSTFLFLNFALQPTPQTKIKAEGGANSVRQIETFLRVSHAELESYSYELYFTVIDTANSQNMDRSSCIIQYFVSHRSNCVMTHFKINYSYKVKVKVSL